jgi:hypothetical protein
MDMANICARIGRFVNHALLQNRNVAAPFVI